MINQVIDSVLAKDKEFVQWRGRASGVRTCREDSPGQGGEDERSGGDTGRCTRLP